MEICKEIPKSWEFVGRVTMCPNPKSIWVFKQEPIMTHAIKGSPVSGSQESTNPPRLITAVVFGLGLLGVLLLNIKMKNCTYVVRRWDFLDEVWADNWYMLFHVNPRLGNVWLLDLLVECPSLLAARRKGCRVQQIQLHHQMRLR